MEVEVSAYGTAFSGIFDCAMTFGCLCLLALRCPPLSTAMSVIRVFREIDSVGTYKKGEQDAIK